MGSDNLAPIIDKVLHADGSVTTLAGEAILPPDPSRAREYESRAANADKWLLRDGSVIDRSGRVILEADESRAEDYASRMAKAILEPGGGANDSAFHVFDGPAHLVLSSQHYIDEMDDILTMLDFVYQMTDTASAVIQGG